MRIPQQCISICLLDMHMWNQDGSLFIGTNKIIHMDKISFQAKDKISWHEKTNIHDGKVYDRSLQLWLFKVRFPSFVALCYQKSLPSMFMYYKPRQE
jgi:hypothetical protein